MGPMFLRMFLMADSPFFLSVSPKNPFQPPSCCAILADTTKEQTFIFGRLEEADMAEVEIQQLGPYTITELLQTNATSALYRGKQGKKSYIIKRLTIPLPT